MNFFSTIPAQKVDEFFAYLANRMYSDATTKEADGILGVKMSRLHLEALQSGLTELQKRFNLLLDLPTWALQKLYDDNQEQLDSNDGDLRMMKIICLNCDSIFLENLSIESKKNLIDMLKIFHKILNLGGNIAPDQISIWMSESALGLEFLATREGKKALKVSRKGCLIQLKKCC